MKLDHEELNNINAIQFYLKKMSAQKLLTYLKKRILKDYEINIKKVPEK